MAAWWVLEGTHKSRWHVLSQLEEVGVLDFRDAYVEHGSWAYLVSVGGVRRVLASREVETWLVGLVDGLRVSSKAGGLPSPPWPLPH